MTQEDYSKLLDDMTNAAIAGDMAEYTRLEAEHRVYVDAEGKFVDRVIAIHTAKQG